MFCAKCGFESYQKLMNSMEWQCENCHIFWIAQEKEQEPNNKPFDIINGDIFPKSIKLNLIDIKYSKKASKEQLQTLEQEDQDDHYVELLPELNETLYFDNSHDLHIGIVVKIKNQNYIVKFFENPNEDPWEAKGKYLILEKTDQNETIPSKYGKIKFFGRPNYIQNNFYPLDLNGNFCYNLLTIENGWGDAGNFNILIGFNDQNIPDVAYFEASCF